MGQGRKLYEEWRDRGVPKAGVPRQQLEGVLRELLPDHHHIEEGSGSHLYVVRHPWMVALPEYAGRFRQLAIPVKSGRIVNRTYVEDLIEVVEFVAWVKRIHRDSGRPAPGEQQPIDSRFGSAFRERD